MAPAVSMITASKDRAGSCRCRKAQAAVPGWHSLPGVSASRLWARASRALPRVCSTRARDRRHGGHWRSEARSWEVLAEAPTPEGEGEAAETELFCKT